MSTEAICDSAGEALVRPARVKAAVPPPRVKLSAELSVKVPLVVVGVVPTASVPPESGVRDINVRWLFTSGQGNVIEVMSAVTNQGLSKRPARTTRQQRLSRLSLPKVACALIAVTIGTRSCLVFPIYEYHGHIAQLQRFSRLVNS